MGGKEWARCETSGGVRDESDAACACITEFSHRRGQLARLVSLTDWTLSLYLQ